MPLSHGSLHAQALLTGTAGSTGVLEIANEHNLRGGTQGVTTDSLHNLCQVTLFNECRTQGLRGGQAWSPLLRTGTACSL